MPAVNSFPEKVLLGVSDLPSMSDAPADADSAQDKSRKNIHRTFSEIGIYLPSSAAQNQSPESKPSM
jgi:hypothetical protein